VEGQSQRAGWCRNTVAASVEIAEELAMLLGYTLALTTGQWPVVNVDAQVLSHNAVQASAPAPPTGPRSAEGVGGQILSEKVR
jgi:hypothetical protein